MRINKRSGYRFAESRLRRNEYKIDAIEGMETGCRWMRGRVDCAAEQCNPSFSLSRRSVDDEAEEPPTHITLPTTQK